MRLVASKGTPKDDDMYRAAYEILKDSDAIGDPSRFEDQKVWEVVAGILQAPLTLPPGITINMVSKQGKKLGSMQTMM